MSDDRDKKLAQFQKAYESGILDEDTYQTALAGLGVTLLIQTNLEGAESIAIGNNSKAAGEGAVIAESVGQNIVTGDNNSVQHIVNQYYPDRSKEASVDSSNLGQQIGSYLTWLQDRCGTIELRGIKREGQQVVQLDLKTVYVPLAAKDLRESRGIHLDQVLDMGQRIVITGGPGSGKTTVLLYIAWTLATAIATNNPSMAQDKLNLIDTTLQTLREIFKKANQLVKRGRNLTDVQLKELSISLERAKLLIHQELKAEDSIFEELRTVLQSINQLIELREIFKKANQLVKRGRNLTDVQLKELSISLERAKLLIHQELKAEDSIFEELRTVLQSINQLIEGKPELKDFAFKEFKGTLKKIDKFILIPEYPVIKEFREFLKRITQFVQNLKDRLPLPIFIPLGAYATYLRQLSPNATAQQRTLAAFISNYLIEKQSGFDLLDDFFQYLLRESQMVILLLDGLDEVPDESERVRVRQAIEDLLTGRETMRVVVTCRTAAYRDRTALGKGFREVQVLPLEDKHIDALVQQAYTHIYRSDQVTSQNKANELLQGIRDLEEIRQRRLGGNTERLVTSPLLVRMLLIVHFSERRLPDQRAELYMKATDTMLLPEYALDEEIADHLGRLVGGSREIHRDLVQRLAFEMHNQGEIKGREITEDELRQVLSSDSTYAGLVNDFIALTRLRGTLLEERLGVYQFIHLAFQEYLVARYMAEVVRGVEGIATFLEEGRLLEIWWREPTLLMAGYLSMTSPPTAHALLRRLAASEGAQEIQLAAAELAGTALLEWPSFSGDLRQELATRLALLFNNRLTNQITLSQRLLAGRVWGLLGYPGITTLPPLLTPILEGVFLYGEKKQRRKIAPFQAGIYPITNAQFSWFIKAGGYKKQMWWSDEGWEWRQERGWTEPRFWNDTQRNLANQPVVGVSWYEAEAFCNWLSATYGQKYRLPTEEEWERLARGQDGREYPWGNEWQEGLANTVESKIGQPCAVGLFLDGISPAGAHDCAGNVWEWCANWYNKEKRFRMLRGGAFFNNQYYVLCSFRLGISPFDRDNDVGYRVVSPIS